MDQFLKFDERKILKSPGKVSKELAKKVAENEFEKYRITQDRLFESNFDKEIKKLEKEYLIKPKPKTQKKLISDSNKSKKIERSSSTKHRKKSKSSFRDHLEVVELFSKRARFLRNK